MAIPWDPERVAQGRANFERLAAEAGLPFGVRTRWANSRLAHEAAEWAREQGAFDAYHRALFRAYFVDALNLGDVAVLADLAAGCGLDAGALREALAAGRYRAAVQAQVDEAADLGVSAVPTFVAGRYAVVGAQPVEMLRRLMAAAEAAPASPPSLQGRGEGESGQ